MEAVEVVVVVEGWEGGDGGVGSPLIAKLVVLSYVLIANRHLLAR